jgi:hypothetical protein
MKRMCAPIHARSLTCTYARMHARTRSHHESHGHTRSRLCAHAGRRAHTLTYTHARTHARLGGGSYGVKNIFFATDDKRVKCRSVCSVPSALPWCALAFSAL